MLVSKFTTAEQVALMLRITNKAALYACRARSIARESTAGSRKAAEGDGGVAYSLGPNPPARMAAISTRLAAMKRDASDLKVVIRA